MRTILTASWFTKLPSDATAVGISRGTPRRQSGFRRLRALEPGTWFNSVPPTEFLSRYRDILDRLNPSEIHDQLFTLGDTPVMLCWEHAADCQAGRTWCHRHIVAQWLEDRLGIEVHEIGHPNLDRFALLRHLRIDPPQFGAAGDRNFGSDNDKYRS